MAAFTIGRRGRGKSQRGEAVAEGLEDRRLLAATLTVEVNVGFTGVLSFASGIPSGTQTVCYTNLAQVAADVPAGEGLEISGSIVVEWYGGAVVASIPEITQQSTPPSPYPQAFGASTLR